MARRHDDLIIPHRSVYQNQVIYLAVESFASPVWNSLPTNLRDSDIGCYTRGQCLSTLKKTHSCFAMYLFIIGATENIFL